VGSEEFELEEDELEVDELEDDEVAPGVMAALLRVLGAGLGRLPTLGKGQSEIKICQNELKGLTQRVVPWAMMTGLMRPPWHLCWHLFVPFCDARKIPAQASISDQASRYLNQE
jgi:hypothetical protein